VEVSSYAASMPDVQLNIKQGETYRLGDLLYSLMLESHNDTAVAIAEHLGGSVEGFAEMMNEKAEALGCENTHFVTPNGLDDDEHYTTAKELCMIGAYAIENEDFRKIIATDSYQFQELSGARSFTVSNHDAFLQQYSGALGIKTGFTGNAGYCFCGAATRNGRTLVTAVLACGWPPNKTYKWSDTKKLMDYGFEGFTSCEIPQQTDSPVLSVLDGQQSQVALLRTEETDTSLSLPLTANDSITITKQLPEHLTAPVRAGDIAGYEYVSLNGECIREIPLIVSEDVEKVDVSYLLRLCIRIFCFS
jgi:D-alanyl-D-alanine carboxypeptidase (penicillin-binding protein 5/6)